MTIQTFIENLSPENIQLYGLRIAGVIIAASIVGWISRQILIKYVGSLAAKSETQWDDALVQARVFRRIARFAPALIIYFSAGLLPDEIAELVRRLLKALMLFMAAMVGYGVLNGANIINDMQPIGKRRNIKSIIQMVQIILGFIAGIIILATLMQASPWKFLSGLGALSAILLLVFKDSIMGLVASIQVSANNMVQVGDWVELPKYGADGDVIDISLNTVKVQNWDKTISTVPTYSLISDPVKNWRGMSEGQGRRIKRALSLDMNTVKFCDDTMLNDFERFEHVGEYIQQRRKEIEAYNSEKGKDTAVNINGRRMTNLGCFRAYIQGYLKNHPMINQNMTLLVRQLAPGENGLPIEIYVFSSDKNWNNYESIQADIFDHLIAAVSEFELAVFQAPSGRDFQKL